MYKALEFFRQNPRANAIEAIQQFEEEFEVEKNTQTLKDEITRGTDLKRKLRPLYGKRFEVEEKMKYILSDIEMEVYLEYPPRKGTDAQREKMRNDLKRENADYMSLHKEFRDFTIQIEEIEDQYKDLELEVKKARRMLELFKGYLEFITVFSKG